MRYAIYSRKSKFTGKGESIENQIEMCRDYIDRVYSEDSEKLITVFEDEGFSGENLRRPEFQDMLAGIKNKQFDYVVCYRLDRISRNVGDFSSLIRDLEKYKVAFICIKEQFDTTTPMGKAMMYIASVFAQLEREAIAERIRDNMLMLARTGRWLGGVTPFGYSSSQISKKSIDGKSKTSFRLVPDKKETDLVKHIFSKYIELGSFTKLETYLINHDIKTRQDKYFTPIALREILSNPVYCIADKQSYQYFYDRKCVLGSEVELFDGLHGIMSYNRTTRDNGSQTKNSMDEWIISVGKHDGLIKSDDFIIVQQTIESRKHLSYQYNPQNPTSLLGGLLVCNQCGSPMRPRKNSSKRYKDNVEPIFYYQCEMKRKSTSVKCNSPNINGNVADKLVCEEILKYKQDNSDINRRLYGLKKDFDNVDSEASKNMKFLQKQIEGKEKEIGQLISILAQSDKSAALFDYTQKQVDDLDKQVKVLRQELLRAEKDSKTVVDYKDQIEIIFDALKSFDNTFRTSSVFDKRRFLRSIIDRIEWDGEDIHIFLYGES